MNTIRVLPQTVSVKASPPQTHRSELKSQTPPAVPSKDSAHITNEWQEQVDWSSRVESALCNLQQSFPGISIYVSSNLSKNELADLAAILGSGNHLIISEDFLKQMASGSEAWEQGKAQLTEALASLKSQQSDAAGKGIYLSSEEKMSWLLQPPEQKETVKTKWEQEAEDAKRLLDRMKEMQEEQKERQKKRKELEKRQNAANYQTAGSYARLASAKTKSNVQWVMGDVRQKIAKLRMASACGDADETRKARAAIRSYQTLLLRGNRKIRRLNEEELVRLRQKRAEQREREDEALRLRLERERQKTKRKTADHMLVEEGRLFDLNQKVYGPHRRSRYQISPDGITTAAPAAASPAPAIIPESIPAGGGGAGGFTAADVTITVET